MIETEIKLIQNLERIAKALEDIVQFLQEQQ